MINNKAHQMREIEHNAFEEHCRASETIREVKVPLWEFDIVNRRDTDKPGKLLTKVFKVKGYDKDAPLPCYACATQRHKCEHDGQDDSEDYPEWWNEV